MEKLDDFKVTGEFVYDGTIHCEITNPKVLEDVKIYPLTKDDIVVSSYPRAGNRWVLEIIWLIMNDARDTDVNINIRVPFLEFDCYGLKSMDILQPGPKILKTHLDYSYYKTAVNENKTKVVVVMRNARDQLVSYYNFYKENLSLGNFPGTWNEFFELFRKKGLVFGSWLDFNLGWWERRHLENVLFVMYEDLKENPMREIRRMAQFCGKNYSDDVIMRISHLTSFEVMIGNPDKSAAGEKGLDESLTSIIRKGKVGDWKNYFTHEQVTYLEETYDVKLKAAGLKFRYEL